MNFLYLVPVKELSKMVCPKCGEKYDYYEPCCPWCGTPKTSDEPKPVGDVSPKEVIEKKEIDRDVFETMRKNGSAIFSAVFYVCALFGALLAFQSCYAFLQSCFSRIQGGNYIMT